MGSGYTRDQLAQLWREVEENVPPLPTDADKKDAPRVVAMRAAGTDLGIVFNFEFKNGDTLVMLFNVVIAKEFAGAINSASQAFGWHKKGMVPAPSEHLKQPTPDDLPSALQVSSLSTYGIPSGILVNLYMPQYGESGATMVFHFPRQAALEVLTYVIRAAEVANWWTPGDFEIIPADLPH